MEYDKKPLKVDAYDFFGYLIPGFILIFAIYITHLSIINNTDIIYLCTNHTILPENLRVSKYIFYCILVTIASYISGHAVGSISSFFYEKLIIKHVFGYPYQTLIFGRKPKQSKASIYKAIATSIYTAITIYIIFPVWTIKLITDYYVYITLVFISCYVLYVISTNKCKVRVLRIISKPFDLIDNVCGQIIHQHTPFPASFREKVIHDFSKKIGLRLTRDMETETFWAIYWYVTNSNTYVRAKIDKWLILYSFMRNIGCALLLSSIIIATTSHYTTQGLTKTAIHATILFVLSSFFILRYYYLYYSYYSKNTFRAFLYVTDQGDGPESMTGCD